MLRKFLAISFALSLFTIFISTEISAQTRVKFKKGSSSGIVTSTMVGNGELSYVLGARSGQEIRVKVTSKNNRVMVEGEGGLTENIFDAVDGDNVIRIYNNSRYSSKFTAVFTIKTLVNQPPTRITFDKGKFSKTFDLNMNGKEKSKKFVIRAMASQTVNISIDSDTDSERITMNLENGVDDTDDWVDGFGYLVITTGRDGDYIFEVIKNDTKPISTKMKVFIGNDQ